MQNSIAPLVFKEPQLMSPMNPLLTNLPRSPIADRERPLALLHVEAGGVSRHVFLHSSQEEQSDHVPTSLASLPHVPHDVDLY